MNLAAVLEAAKRASAAYEVDQAAAQAAFGQLGLDFLGQYQDGSHQAALSHDPTDGAIYLSISGTRFSSGKLGDLFDDLDLDPVDTGAGAMVTKGAYEGLSDMWAWARQLAPPGATFNVEGHSLGGWRTAYTPLFLEVDRIGQLVALESPKPASQTYWCKYDAELSALINVVNGRDLWVSWPFDLLNAQRWVHQPRNRLWLTGDPSTPLQVIMPDQWPGGRSPADHDIDLVVTRLSALVGSTQP